MTSEDDTQKHQTWHRSDRIDDLLGSVSDPVQRSIVIVLSNISRDLVAQTEATNALTALVGLNSVKQSEMDRIIKEHINDEEVFLSGIRSSTRILQWIAPIICTVIAALGSYIWIAQSSQIGELAAESRITRQRQLVNEEKIASNERRMQELLHKLDEVLKLK